jgi:hypothetical protein
MKIRMIHNMILILLYQQWTPLWKKILAKMDMWTLIFTWYMYICPLLPYLMCLLFSTALLWDHTRDVSVMHAERLWRSQNRPSFVAGMRLSPLWEDRCAPPVWPQWRSLGWRSSCRKGSASTLGVNCARKLSCLWW